MPGPDVKVLTLGPFTGLDGRRYADDLTQPQSPTPMRGGFNVELVDGELWVRRGMDYESGTKVVYASIPWSWLIDVNGLFNVLASPYHVLSLRTTDGAVTNLTSPAVSESITFTQGSASATSTSTLTKNDLILVGASGFTTGVYRITNSPSDTSITLDRNYEATSGAQTCRVINSFFSDSDDIPFGFSGSDEIYLNSTAGGWGIIDQLVTHGSDDIYSGSPAVTAGHRYLVIAHGALDSEGVGPVAINLTSVGAPLGGFGGTNWFRSTWLAAPAAIDTPLTCCVHENRLVFGNTVVDPNGQYPERTIYFSWPGDMLLFHVGLAGDNNSAPLYVTFNGEANAIQSVKPLGENLIIYRQFSQEVGFPNGSASAPYQFRSNEQGVGLTVPQAIVEANRQHYLVTQLGPSSFSVDTGVQPIAQGMEWAARATAGWQDVELIAHDQGGRRLYFFPQDGTRHSVGPLPASANVTIGSTSLTWDNAEPVLVYAYEQGMWWMEDHIKAMGSGTVGDDLFLLRPDGTVVQVDNYGTTGFDPDQTGSGTHVVDALVDLPWIALGSPGKRAMIRKVVVGLRALDVSLTVGTGQQVTDLWTLTSETLHFGTVSLFADHQVATAAATADMNMVVSTMRAKGSDENNQLPLMEFTLTGLRKAAMSFKIRVANVLSAAATSAGHTKAHFRIAYIRVFYVTSEGDRLEVPDSAG